MERARHEGDGRERAPQRQGARAPTMPRGVLLGLIATTAGITLLEYLTAPSGQGPTLTNTLGLFLPTSGALALYAVLQRLSPQGQRDARDVPRSVLALLALVCAACAARVLPFPTDEVAALAAYGAVVHARVARGRVWARRMGAALALGFLPVGLVGLPALNPEAFGIWLIGLLYVYAVTDQGVTERAARARSEGLVRALEVTQDQLRAYAAQAEDVATLRERARLARELHDTLAQGLAAITMHLDSGNALFDTQPARAREALRRAREIAGTQLQETRASVLALRPDAPTLLPLPLALAALADAWRPWTDAVGGRATFRADADARTARYAPPVELACYRAAQEALHNAARHSQARHVEMELSLEPDGVCLTVTDDGCGFDPAAVRPRADGGWGLLGLCERLALVGGRCEVISAPGAGTQVVATVPLHTSSAGVRVTAG